MSELEPNPDPVKSLDAHSGIICVVGAGGKSALIQALVEAHPGRVALTGTVEGGPPSAGLARNWLSGEEAELRELLPAAAAQHRVVGYSGPRLRGDRHAGLRPELIAELHAAMGVEATYVEADSAEDCLITALARDERPLVPGTDLVLSVLSVQSLGRPLDELAAHRPDLVAQITGARLGQILEIRHLVRLAVHQFRMLRRCTDAPICPIFNMADGVPPEQVSEIPLGAIREEPAIDRFAISCLTLEPPLVRVMRRSSTERPAASGGAAGGPEREEHEEHQEERAVAEEAEAGAKTGDLLDVLEARSGIVCVVGAGGKKTLIQRLVESHPGRVAVTCTARTTAIPPDLTPNWLAGDDEELKRELPAAPHIFRVVAYTGPLGRSERYDGVRPDLVAGLHARMGVEATYVKADGARMRWIKAHQADEPPLVPGAATILALLSVRALGRPLDEKSAHRPELVAEITGARLGATLEPEHLARLMGRQYRLLKERSSATVIPILNMVDDEAARDQAIKVVARAMAEDDDLDKVLMTSLAADPPLMMAIVR